MILLELHFSLNKCTQILIENKLTILVLNCLVQGNSGIFSQLIPLLNLSSGVLLAMNIILSVLHRNTLDAIKRCESQQVQGT